MRNNYYHFRIISGLFLFLLVAFDAWAAAAAKRMQQQKAMQQQMMQQQYQQQMAQKQAQEVAAYQQALAQRQAQMQQIAAQQQAAAQYAAQKQAMQQAVAQRITEAQAAAKMQQLIAQKQAQEIAQYEQQAAYQQVQKVVGYKQSQAIQQAVAAKSQAELNGQIQEYANFLTKRRAAIAQQAVVQEQARTAEDMAQYYERQKMAAAQNSIALQVKVQQEAIRRRMGQQAGASGVVKTDTQKGPKAVEPQEETVVSIEDLWAALDQSSVPWGKIIDTDIKRLTVAEYIDRFKKQGIKISRSPGEYVGVINTMAEQNASFLNSPFLNVLSYAAIVEYDFDNGENKDALARKALGEENFLANRKRLFGR